MRIQNTSYSRLVKSISDFLTTSLIGPWKQRSTGLLSILLGFYIGSNLTVYFFERTGNRLLIVLLMVFLVESLIRLRTNISLKKAKIIILILDNLRIGSVYAVVLEAFKLGS
tara:strand:+ start:1104 stop:1439 length:336 start_codon:yes stop_codon:yes gene_type:complete